MASTQEKRIRAIPQSETKNAELSLSKYGHQTLDPSDWESFRVKAHPMLDDILDYTKNVRQRPVWQPIPDEVRARFRGALPAGPSPLAEVHQEFMDYILPFAAGNVHPGFMGWVQGGGTRVGIPAEMLAAALNGIHFRSCHSERLRCRNS
jgi:aromatic-L-amino-acid/L-tryptophan decarboxylase